MLEHWGYPYVMEEYRFHMSLTDRIDDAEERETIFGALENLAKPVLGKTIMARHITVFGQSDRNEPMAVVERIPFGRSE